jgi:hypothetical protein
MRKFRCPAATLENAQCRNVVRCKAELCGVHAQRGFLIGDYYVRAINGPVGVTSLKPLVEGEPDIVLFGDRHSLPLEEDCPESVEIWSDEFLSALNSVPGPVVLGLESHLWEDVTLKFWASADQPERRAKMLKFLREVRENEGGPLDRLDAKLRPCVLGDAGCKFKNLRVVYSQLRELGEALTGPQLTRYYWDYLLLESIGFMTGPWIPSRAEDGGQQAQERARVYRTVVREVAQKRGISPVAQLKEVEVGVAGLLSLDPAAVKAALFPKDQASASVLCRELERVPARKRQEFEQLLPHYVALEGRQQRPSAGFVRAGQTSVEYLFTRLKMFVKGNEPDFEFVTVPYEVEVDLAAPVAMAYEDCYFLLRTFGKHAGSTLVVGYFGAEHVWNLAGFFHNMRQSHQVIFDEHPLESRCLAPQDLVGINERI